MTWTKIQNKKPHRLGPRITTTAHSFASLQDGCDNLDTEADSSTKLAIKVHELTHELKPPTADYKDEEIEQFYEELERIIFPRRLKRQGWNRRMEHIFKYRIIIEK
ncbi:hypothetical protein DPMN_104863 [Dreissena polymorpha]|uniref:Uncharacterized protein n=1 Tax=Dreissena polymorpha TaxID=45954 RepID=A0A9D4HAI9_DREPO|nr:hypothetical protein DPMN_104863 [Dreissena polymorpha]